MLPIDDIMNIICQETEFVEGHSSEDEENIDMEPQYEGRRCLPRSTKTMKTY